MRNYKPVLLLLVLVTLLALVNMVFADTAELLTPSSFTNTTLRQINLTFNMSVDSNGSVSNFSLFFGQPGTWTRNLTNGTAAGAPLLFENNSISSFNITVNDDGVYNWSIEVVLNATDATPSGFVFMNSTNYTITVDTTPANVSLTAPTPLQNFSANFDINASVNDSVTGVANVTYRYENSTQNGTWVTLNSIGSADGKYGIVFVALSVVEGRFNITINATDIVGNQNVSQQAQIIVDTSTPNVTLLAPAAGNYSGSLLFNASANDTFSSVKNVSFGYERPGVGVSWLYAVQNPVGFWQFTLATSLLADGVYNVSVNATDSAGNQNVTANITQVLVDNVGPNVSVVLPAVLQNFSADFVVNASVNDTTAGVSLVQFRYENSTHNGSWSVMGLLSGDGVSGGYNGTLVVGGLADGRYNLTVNGTDTAGNQNYTGSPGLYGVVAFQIDRAAPNLSGVVPVNGSVVSGNVLINGSANDSVSGVFDVAFRLISADGAVVSAWLDAALGSGGIGQGYWAVTFDTTGVADDAYNITMNATDFAGGQNVVNVSWVTVSNGADVAAPNVSIVVPVAFANVSGSFLVNASVNDSVVVSLVNVSLLNASGNVSGPFIMSLGSGSLTAGYWNASVSTLFLVDGFYNVSVNGTDGSGNVNISANVSVLVDNTAPNVSLFSPAEAAQVTGTIVINASVNDTLSNVSAVAFRYANATAEGGWTAMTRSSGYYNATLDTNTLALGFYNISINATDFAGNQNASVNRSIEIVDLAAPTVTLHVPVSRINSTAVNVSFNFTGVDSSGLKNATLWANFSGTWQANASNTTTLTSGTAASLNVSNVPETYFAWNILVCDAAATPNCGFAASNYTMTVDRTTPNLSMASPASGNYSGNLVITASVNDTLTGIQHVAFRYANNTYQSVWNPMVVSGVNYEGTLNTLTLAEGGYNLSVNASDFAGNENISANRSVLADNTAPNVSILSPTASQNLSADFLINASVNETLTGLRNVSYRYENSTHNGSFITMTESASGYFNATVFTSSLADGRYNISVNATDTAGNQNATEDVPALIIDTQPPSITSIHSPSNNSNRSGSVLVNATVTDMGTGVKDVNYRYMNTTHQGPWTTMTQASGYYNATLNTALLADGRYNISINATDYAGFKVTSANVSLLVDNEAPQFTNWQLNVSDGTNITRGGRLLASSLWADSFGLATAIIEHNGTGTLQNYTISSFAGLSSWANYTLNTANASQFSKVGLINITRIYVNDTSGNVNSTTPHHFFHLFGFANMTSFILPDSLVHLNHLVYMGCLVQDSNTTGNIRGYPVTFSSNVSGTLGTNTTGSDGIAQFGYNFTQAGSHNLTCAIADQQDIFYNATAFNSKSAQLLLNVYAVVNVTVLNRTLQPFIGANVTLSAEGTEVSAILNASNASFSRNITAFHVNVTIIVPTTNGNVTLTLLNINLTHDVSLLTYVVKDYNGSLPTGADVSSESRVDKITPFIFVDTSSYAMSNASVQLPREQLLILQIGRCTSYDAPSGNCTSWLFNSTGDYEPSYLSTDQYISFDVQRFSGYAGGASLRLDIFDDTDTIVRLENQSVRFFANLTNITGHSANETGTMCNASFTFIGNSSRMTFNTSSLYYEYNRSFNTSGPYFWQVNCSVPNYAMIKAEDGLYITPGWSTVASDIAGDGWAEQGVNDANNWNPSNHDDDMYVGRLTGATNERLSLVTFNLTRLPGNMRITKAQMRLRVQEIQGNVGDINVFLLNESACDTLAVNSTADFADVIACTNISMGISPSQTQDATDELTVVNLTNTSVQTEKARDNNITFYFRDPTIAVNNYISWDTSVATGTDSGTTFDPPVLYVEYRLPPIYTGWQLNIPDGSNVSRGDFVEATALWNENISFAYLEHNGSGAVRNYTVPGPYLNDETNYTLQLLNTSEFNRTGLINITTLYANSTYNLWNNTVPAKHFYLWGDANVTRFAPPSSARNATTINLLCEIQDKHIGRGIQNYNVTFLSNASGALSTIGRNITNATGWALLGASFPEIGDYALACNITRKPEIYYNASVTNITATISIVPDTAGPFISLAEPLNGSEIASGAVNFTYQVSDALSGVQNCSLFLNSTFNMSDPAPSEGITLNFTRTGVNEGAYSWHVSCTDDYSTPNTNNSETRIFVFGQDTKAPNVSLMSPANGSIDTNGALPFVYNVTDGSAVTACSLLLNGTLNATNTSIPKNTPQNFTIPSFNNGFYRWSVNCTDESGNMGNSSERNFSVSLDITAPTIVIVLPNDNAQDGDGNVDFNFTVTDANNVASCNLTLDGAVNKTISNVAKGPTINFSVRNMNNGAYLWNITCADDAEDQNSATTSTRTLHILQTSLLVLKVTDHIFDSGMTSGSGLGPARSVFTVWNPSSDAKTVSRLVDNYTADDPIVGNIPSAFPSAGWSIADGDANWAGSQTIAGSTAQAYYYNFHVDSNLASGSSWSGGTLNATAYDELNRTNRTGIAGFDNPKQSTPWILTALSTNNASYDYVANASSAAYTAFYVQLAEFSCSGSVSTASCPATLTVRLADGWEVTACAESPDLCNDAEIRWENIPINGFTDTTCGLPPRNFSIHYSFTGRPPIMSLTNYTLVNVTFNYCDSNGNRHNTIGQHILQLNVNNLTPPAITFNDPALNITGYTYSGITSPSSSHNASSGGIANQPPTSANSPLTGTEASTIGYQNLSSRDTARYKTLVSTTGLHAYHSFNFKITQSPVDIQELVIHYQGYATQGTSQSASPFSIYVYNHTSDSYTQIAAVNSSSSDVSLIESLRQGFTDLVVNTDLWLLVEGDFLTGSGANARADLYTNYIDVKITTFPAISSSKLLNITATDADGVQNCEYRYEQTSPSTSFAGMAHLNADYFTNTSDTTTLADGVYLLRARCFDIVNNQNNATLNVTINNAAPTIALQSPENNTNYTQTRTVTFIWNASDSRGGTLTCDLGVDSFVNQSSVLSQNNANTSQPVNNFNDGYHYWNVTCRNTAGVINTSQIRNFTVDLTAPNITLAFPAGNNFTSARNQTFSYTPYDAVDLTNCSILVDRIVNSTNSSVLNKAVNNFSIANFNEGNHSWAVNCTDRFNRVNGSVVRNFTVDYTAPFINLSAPADAASFTNNTVQFNFTTFDTVDNMSLSCDLRVNGVVEDASISTRNGSIQIRNITLADGSKLWNVTCRDDAGNVNTSETRSFTLTGPPDITLFSPVNNSHVRGTNVTFNYTPDDGDGLANCSLVINDKINATNATTLNNGGTNLFNLSNLSDQRLTWTVNCTDTTGQEGTATARVLTIDNTGPFVNLTRPADGFSFTNSSVQLNFTPFDNLAGNLSCNLTVNSILEQSGIPSFNSSSNLRNLTLGSGNKQWNVTCTDLAGNSNTSRTGAFTVLGAPTVIIQTPANNSITNGSNIPFTFIPDDLDPVASCSLIINDQINQSNTSALTLASTNTFRANLSAGTYNWTVNCTDTSGNRGTDDPFNLSIDTTPPWFNLSAPANGATLGNATVQFNFTAHDNVAGLLTCSLFVNGTAAAANQNFAVSNSSIQIRNQTLAEASYIWNVSCVDTVGLANVSGTRSFNIDLAPRILLQSPANATFFNSNATLVYNVTDVNGLANCSLIVNGAINQTNASLLTNNANNTFNLSNASNERIEWTVQCADLNQNVGNDTVRTLYSDITAPAVRALQPNGTAFTTSTIDVIFNVTDNNATSLTCDITVNGTVEDNDFSATAGQNTTRSISLSGDGFRIYNITCSDNANVNGTSATLNFSIESGPTITLLAPANDSADLDGNVTFFYNATDTNLASCSLLIDGIFNATNTTVVQSGNLSNFTTSNFTQGLYNWTVNCSDTTGFTGQTANFTLHVDFTPPSLVNLTNPANATNVSSSTVTFNFTAVDNVDPLLNCTLSVNGTVNQTLINASNGQPTTRQVSGFNVGDYNWSVTCQDNANLTNTSTDFFFTIDVNPKVTLSTPVSETNTSLTKVNFSYTPTSVFGIDNCQLFVDEASAATDIFVETGEINYFNVTMAEGRHNWTVSCDDQNIPAKTANGGQRNITADFTPPFIQPNNPNGSPFNTVTATVNFTFLDNLSTFGICNITINTTINDSGIYAPNGTSVNRTLTGFSDGLHLWNATCTDVVGNTNTSSSLNFTIAEPPRIILGSPANLTRTNSTNQSFNFTVSDNSGSVASCTVMLNGQLNETNASINVSANNWVNVDNLSHNQYSWTINCTDAAGNFRQNDTIQILRIDLLGPDIALNAPTQNQVFNTEDITFNLTPTDQFDLLTTQSTCSIFIDGSLNRTLPGINSTADNLTLIQGFSIGRHNWSVSCRDDLGNLNATGNVSFIVNAPDLTLNATHITFNNTNPDDGQSITVNATIFNVGGNPATNASVEFFDFNGTNESRFSIQNLSVDAGKNATIMANLTMSPGLHQVIIAIDQENLVVELNDSNNNASRNISILTPALHAPASNTVQNRNNVTVNLTVRNYRNADINFTLYVDGRFNLTNLTFDNRPNITQLNMTEGVHTIIVGAFESDPLNNATFRHKNSSAVTVTVDLTLPVVNITTANNTFFSDATPTVFFNITDNLDSVLNYTVYVNTTIEDKNFTANASGANVTLASRGNGSYLITVEARDDAGNRVNGTPKVIYVDTDAPHINITTANNTNFSDLTPEIGFNVSDNLDQVVNFTVFVDGEKDTNATTQLGQNATNLTVQSEGEHNITIEAADDAGNQRNSTPIRIFIDVTAPAITIDSPTAGDVDGFIVNLLTTITDGGTGIANASYTIVNNSPSGELLQTGTLTAPDYDTTWDSLQDIDNASHTNYVNLTVTANDTVGNANSATVLFIVDNRNPGITFIVPGGQTFNASFNLSIQVENYNLSLSNYSIFNSTHQQQNNTNSSILNATFAWTDLVNLSNVSRYPEGSYNISVYADDSVGSVTNASNYFFVDRTAPNITLETPLNTTNFSSVPVDFNFTATDNFDASMTCNLTIDNSVQKQNFAAANNTRTNATIGAAFADGFHYWAIQCIDNAGNRNTTIARNFSMDSTAPSITLTAPANNTFNNSQSISFTYTPTDATTGIQNCSLLLNGTENTTASSIVNGAQNNFTVENFNEGAYLWNVRCTDFTGNSAVALNNYTITMDFTAPTANITTPNGTHFSTGTPNATINLTDNFDAVLNYTLFVDGEKDASGNATARIASNATLNFHNNGTYSLLAEALDRAGNRANSTPINITIDTILPTITLAAPANSTNITTLTVYFNFTATDNLTSSLSCDLIVDNAVNASATAMNGTSQNISAVNFTAGLHSWSVNCTDSAGNRNSSVQFSFNVTQPDITFTPQNVSFNASLFEEGNITILLNITNAGPMEAQNILVQWFNSSTSQAFEIANTTIAHLGGWENTTVNISSAFGIGDFTIYGVVDNDGSITESTENNNQANASFRIPLWNTVSGNVTGDYVLQNGTPATIFQWVATTNTSGTVFATDIDSSITWNNLTALGTNRSGNISVGDFAELDAAMNSTGYGDSVNRTYLNSSGTIRNQTFVLFTNTIRSVALANSTNNTNFLTGILWDSADDHDGEFNGSEDVLFMTNISRAREGAYGVYDYELRVPATLRNYKGPDKITIALYLELQ